MLKKYSKLILFIGGSGLIILAFLVQKPKAIKGEMVSRIKSVKDDRMTNNERREYHLENPFTEKDLMPFSVQSDTAIAYDFDSGKILYAKNIDTKRPTASISKIVTATIAIENASLDKILTVPKAAAEIIPNKIVMKEGEKVKLNDLLYGMMMISANDAAETIAEGIFDSRDKFIEKMNEKVKWLELKNSNFAEPAGFDNPNHYSTPYDLGVFTRYTLKKHPELLKFMGQQTYSIPAGEGSDPHWFQHTSGMLKSYPGMDGAKTGYTWDAGQTFIGTAKRDDKRIVVIVFNTQNAASDIKTLLDYGFKISSEK